MQNSFTIVRSRGRTWLFVPGSNKRYLAKAAECEADVLLLDLEDGVLPCDKQRGREMLAAYLGTPSGADVFVRVNAWQTGQLPADLDAVVQPGLDGICLPKAESAADVRRLADRLAGLEAQRGLESAPSASSPPSRARAPCLPPPTSRRPTRGSPA